MKKYFVIDRQGMGWKEGTLFNTVKEIADSIRQYDDYDPEEHGKMSDTDIINLWDFEFHRLTPANCVKYYRTPRDWNLA